MSDPLTKPRRALPLRPLIALCLALAAASALAAPASKKVIIAHRGACGYLPEHTLQSATLAHSWDVDFIEPDVVMTRDGALIVLHDIHLDATTDVAARYPKRARPDGRFYAIDFDLLEVQTLSVFERKNPATGQPAFPKRYPGGGSGFKVPTLVQFLDLIDGLNRSRKRRIGVYPEIKDPAFHAEAGKDISLEVLRVLRKRGYEERPGEIFLQSFDPRAIKRLRRELATAIPLIQLIADDSWGESDIRYAPMRRPEGLKEIAKDAAGIGVWLGHLYEQRDGRMAPTSLARDARAAGLKVHAYTLRADALPPGAPSFGALLRDLLFEQGIDGVFTDHGDQAIKALRSY